MNIKPNRSKQFSSFVQLDSKLPKRKISLDGFLVETKSFNPILRTSNSHYFFHQMPFLQSENLSKTRYLFSGLDLASFQFSNQWWWVIVPKKRVEIWTFSTSIQKTWTAGITIDQDALHFSLWLVISILR